MIMIMPCLIELGKATEEVHRKIGEKVKEKLDLLFLTNEDCYSFLRSEAGEKVVLIENPEELVRKVLEITKNGDIVILEGRSPEFIKNNLLEKSETN